MAISKDRLQELMRGENLRYFLAPDEPLVRFGIRGSFGDYDVLVGLYEQGRFLQIRTIGYLQCPSDHRHLPVVLALLAEANFTRRLVKFGWDKGDGEIMAYADLWLMDADLTQEQFHAMMGGFVRGIDIEAGRLTETIRTGEAPGEPRPAPVPREGPERGGGADPKPEMSAELRELLDKLARGGAGKKAAPEDSPISEV